MTPYTLAQVRTAVQGRASKPFHSPGAQDAPMHRLPDREVTRVSTDTRDLKVNDLFVALVGERFDGHDFLAAAASAGVGAAVVHRVPPDVPADLPLIVVDDTRKALGRLAQHYRRSLKHTKVIAVCGSNGKTGTKQLIHAALCNHLRGTASPKSFNNDIGVPLTLFPVEPRDDYVVVECGTNHPGEIEHLASICEPDIAVITNAGPEHLEFLGDLAGVRRENASIVSGLRRDGCLVVHGDDKALVAACGGAARRVTFGFEQSNDLFAADVRCDFDGVRFRLNGSRIEVKVPMLGRHVAANALAAVAVARRLAVPDAPMLTGLAEAVGPDMRLQQTVVRDIRIINDAYNANPASTAAAIETLRELPHPGRKVFVFGDMLELGDGADEFHRQAGRHAAQAGLHLLVAVGTGAALAAAGAASAGMSSAAVHAFPDADQASRCIHDLIRAGDLVLLKASRGVRLEQVAHALAGDPQADAA